MARITIAAIKFILIVHFNKLLIGKCKKKNIKNESVKLKFKATLHQGQ